MYDRKIPIIQQVVYENWSSNNPNHMKHCGGFFIKSSEPLENLSLEIACSSSKIESLINTCRTEKMCKNTSSKG